MKEKKWVITGIAIVLFIAFLVIAQYRYSSKNEVFSRIAYQETIKINYNSDMAIFKHKDKLIGFIDRKNVSKWLIKDEYYDVKYKKEMWHRQDVMIIEAMVSDN